jgi:hypothetical protein
MNNTRSSKNKGITLASFGIGLLVLASLMALAQDAQCQEMQEHLAEIKQSLAFNKQVLAQYTWMEQQIISLKGEQKKEELYNVRLGPDGKPQKTPVDPDSVSDSDRQARGLRGRIRERKIEEYKEYGDSIKTLIQQYIPPDKDMLQQSYQQGNVMIGPMAGQPEQYRIVVTNYIKQGDNMTIVIDKVTLSLVSLTISTYLSDPSDAVNVNAQFTRVPNGGPFHVGTEAINGVSKQLTIEIINTNYQHTIGPGAATGMASQGTEMAPTNSAVSSYPGQGVPATAEELQNLVAPIALYPDALLAQILTAATFPDQVAVASYWVGQNKTLTGSALMTAVDTQTWDPSIKALTQFPSVLNNMAQNLSWTSQLGEDYHNQQADVMGAIQVLRAKAKAAGNLQSGSQITVVQKSPQIIVIQPTNPQIVYIPQYNPTVIYGTPYVVPGYTTGDVVAASVLSFGAGMAVGAMMSSGWGYSSWNCNWYGGAAVYHGGAYYGNSAWHGGYYGTSASAYGAYGSAHASSGYNPATGTYARGASTSTAYGTQKIGQAYNPYTGAYGATHQGSNAYSNWGSSTASKDGQTVDTQHYSDANGTVGTAESSNGNKYATANGSAYKNTGSGWQNAGSSDAAHGWGGSSGSQSHSDSSAFSGWGGHSGDTGDSGWGSRSSSSRGWGSRGGGGGWGGGGFRR